MNTRGLLLAAVVALVVTGCDAKSDNSEPSDSPKAYKQTELPLGLQDAASAIAVNGKGEVAVIETSPYSEPHRVLLLAHGASEPTTVRVRIQNGPLLITDDAALLYVSDDEVKRLRPGADSAEMLPFAVGEDDAVESIAYDRSGNVYALVENFFKYRVLMLKPDATAPVELPFGELEAIELIATTGESDVMLYRSGFARRDPAAVITLAQGAAKPEIRTAPKDFAFQPGAIGPDGSLYVLSAGDEPGEVPGITVLGTNFAVTDRVPLSTTRNGVSQLVVGADGSIYVTDDNRVFRMRKE